MSAVNDAVKVLAIQELFASASTAVRVVEVRRVEAGERVAIATSFGLNTEVMVEESCLYLPRENGGGHIIPLNSATAKGIRKNAIPMSAIEQHVLLRSNKVRKVSYGDSYVKDIFEMNVPTEGWVVNFEGVDHFFPAGIYHAQFGGVKPVRERFIVPAESAIQNGRVKKLRFVVLTGPTLVELGGKTIEIGAGVLIDHGHAGGYQHTSLLNFLKHYVVLKK